MANIIDPLAEAVDVAELLRDWERDRQQPNYNPVSLLELLARVVESESANFLKLNPDPEDSRHPCLSHPECNFGDVLNIILEKEDFMKELMYDYLCDTYQARNCIKISYARKLNIAACRLMLDILPGLETSLVFQPELDNLIQRLFLWAEGSSKLLQCCATNLLAFAMKIHDRVEKFQEENHRLVRLMVKKLRDLLEEPVPTLWVVKKLSPFATFVKNRNVENNKSAEIDSPSQVTQQLFIIRYLTTLGKYPEYTKRFFKGSALILCLDYINPAKIKDERLIFEALKCLSSLLCHDELSTQFLKSKGLQKLMDVRRPTRADDEITLHMIFGKNDSPYWQDTMEGICLMPKAILKGLVTYAMFLLGKDSEFSRSHAMMFFGFAFSFKKVIEQFEAQDGLRKLLNIISKLKDEERSPTCKFIAFSAAALAKYVGAHLYFQTENLREENDYGDFPMGKDPWENANVPQKAPKMDWDEVQTRIESMRESIIAGYVWPPVQKLWKLGGVTFLLQTLSYKRPCNIKYIRHNRTSIAAIENCLDAIKICSAAPNVMELLSGEFEVPTKSARSAMGVLMDAAGGKISKEFNLQRTALRTVGNCLCAPIIRVDETAKTRVRDNEKVIEKIWANARIDRGIMILVTLMEMRRPAKEADSIRSLACRALVGLARSEPVRKILSKLSFFVDGRLQDLIKEPVHPEETEEHASFKKYAEELIEMLITCSKSNVNESNRNSNPKVGNSFPINPMAGCQGNGSKRLDRRQMYSRFCPVKTFKMLDVKLRAFTHCIYSPCSKYLIVGSRSGSIMMLDISTGTEEAIFTDRGCFFNHLETNRVGNLLLTSSSGRKEFEDCFSTLWKIETRFDQKSFNKVKTFDMERHLEFNKRQNSIIGTSNENASIYDIDTGIVLMEFTSTKSHCYRRNRATFSMDDNLVLNDGILWDVKSGEMVHRFDQFSEMSNGVFHPNRKEVILNSNVWDLRTFQLLKDVPSLDKMDVRFSPVNNIIYSYYTDPNHKAYRTSFETLDAFDYDSFTTRDIETDIFSLACNKSDTQIAIVGTQREKWKLIHESCVRVYDVGRVQDEEESLDNDGK